MSIYEVTEDFQTQLLAGERRSMEILGRSYVRLLADIQKRMSSVLSEMQSAELEDKAQRISWLYKHDRLANLHREILQALALYNNVGVATISNSQLEAMLLSQQAFVMQIRSVSGFEIRLATLPVDAISQMMGFLSDGSPLLEVLDGMGADLSNRMRDALLSSVATGINPNQLAHEIRRLAGGNLAKLSTIARTETLRAYRESSLRTYQEHSSLMSGWKWKSALQLRTCAMCWAMHGTTHTLDERFASHPNCRCTMIPLVKGFPDAPRANGEQTFNGLDEDAQRHILGDAKFEKFRSGEISLSDLVQKGESTKWGPYRVEKPLSDL